MSDRQASNGGYRYYAFISYSRKNESWAKWLQRSLETYRLPARMKKEYPEIPKKIFPVFRDKTDLSGVVLEEALKKELSASKYLIVICSPESASSDWVNDEIRFFIEEHGKERVIPFIVDGEPHAADPTKDCFPKALQNIKGDILGISVAEQGKRKAFLRVVSTMLGLRFDDVVQRDRKRRVAGNVFLGAILALLLAVAGYAVLFNTEQSRYYASYITRFEIPEGRGELSAAERKSAFQSFRIVKKRGKVIRVECVNSCGTVISPSLCLDRYPVLAFSYDENGRVSEITQYDIHGNAQLKKLLSYRGDSVVIDLNSPSGLFSKPMQSDLSVTSASLDTNAPKSEIIRQINTYDGNGRLSREMYYMDTLGNPACDINGVYGKEYTYTDEGFVSSATMLDENGNPYNCRIGWATEKYVYDKYGRIVSGSVENAKGEPARNDQGYAGVEIEYDGFAPSAQRYFDENAELCNSIDGAAECVYLYDDRGLLINQKNYGPDGKPVGIYGGIFETKTEYDKKGILRKQSFFNAEGNAVNSIEYGFSFFERTTDDNSRLVEEKYYNATGEPCCDKNGAYILRHSYDTNGYLSCEEAFDAKGNPVMIKWGCSKAVFTNDTDGNIRKIEYFDENGKLCVGKENLAVAVFEYDAYGNRTSARFFDEAGNPCISSFGIHGWDCNYEGGKLESEKYVDIDGQPTICKDFYHEKRFEYDERGNTVRESTYDVDGKLTENVNTRYAVAEYEYNDYGDVTKIAYFNRFGRPSSERGAYYLYEYEYDDKGNVIWEKREADEFADYPYVTVESEFDDYGNVTSKIYRDRNGEQKNVNYTKELFEYDGVGRLVRYDVTFASSGNTIISENKYDEYGNRVLEEFIVIYKDGERKYLYQIRYTFDEYGQVVLTENTDEEGNLFYDEALGYSSLRKEYSPEGYVIAEEFCGENGEKMDVFRYEYERDAVGNDIVTRRYGPDGELVRQEDGAVACDVKEYDSFGYLVKTDLYNENGEPYGADDGVVSSAVYINDSRGYRKALIYYNKNGDEIERGSFYAYISEVYEGGEADKNGVRTGIILQYGDWRFFDENNGAFKLEYEMARLVDSEKKLVMAYLTDDGYEFAEYVLGEGVSEIRIMSDIGNAEQLEQIRIAFEQWSAQQ